MYNIKTLNSISPVYQSILTEGEYTVSADVEKPDAILVRSADMHSYARNEELLCVARAGAGVNNLPLDRLAQAGVPMWCLPDAVIHHKAGGSAGGMLSVYYSTRNTLYLTCKGKSAAYAKLKTILPLLTGAARYALTKLLGRKKGRSYGAFRGAVDFWNGKMGRMEG